ncbi:MAG: hypothetical protein E7616_03620 [Ruminococcaceae bacterium]|nr:hypothetical protein [Oscillospiraceae bacterium]
MKGKDKCKILKEIREKIAHENDIPFVTSECKHQGDCRGTCPKCESELQYLENELAKRQRLGKRIALAGLVATFTLAGTACDFGQVITSTPNKNEIDGDIMPPDVQTETEDLPTDKDNNNDDDVTPGAPPAVDEYDDDDVTAGDPA